MAKQELFVQKNKRGRPAGRTRPETFAIRLRADILPALDRWIGAQPEHMTRAEAIRFAVRDWLVAQGVIEVAGDREDRN